MTKPFLRASLAGALVLVPLAACSESLQEPKMVDQAKIAGSIKADVQTIIDAFNERDADAALTMNARDTRIMSHGQPNMGWDQNLALIRQYVTDPALKLEVENEEVDVAEAGDMALYTATYTWNFSDPNTGEVATEHGNWVMVFKRQSDGSMKIYREVISDTPASDEVAS